MPQINARYNLEATGTQFKPYYAYRRLRKCCLERHDHFEKVKLLPTGGQGQAEVLRRESNKELIVSKSVPHKKVAYYRGDQSDVPEEVKILRDLLPGHDRIINFLDYSVGLEHVTFFYQYYYGGDLHGMINNYALSGVKMPELTIWQAFRQISEALAFLHHGYDRSSSQPRSHWRQVVHRDVKPENILLQSPVSPHMKSQPLFALADFGLATINIGERVWVGTADFQPPEGSEATESADIWALGATIHCMGHENKPPIAPIPGALALNPQQWARNPHAKLPWSFGDKYSSTLELLMFKTFTKNPDCRIDSLSLLKEIEHEFRPAGQAGQLERMNR